MYDYTEHDRHDSAIRRRENKDIILHRIVNKKKHQ